MLRTSKKMQKREKPMPTEYREERLVRVLREQIHKNVEGALEEVIVTNDGLVVAAFPSSVDGPESDPGSSHWVAALAAEIIAQSRRAFGELAQGPVSRILIEGEKRSMIVVPAGDDASLAVIIDNQAKLGIAMFQIARVAEQINALLN
jgi:predicted regulator of Ras-like GTPase activity (Roadblock/LC7/MglB family)